MAERTACKETSFKRDQPEKRPVCRDQSIERDQHCKETHPVNRPAYRERQSFRETSPVERPTLYRQSWSGFPDRKRPGFRNRPACRENSLRVQLDTDQMIIHPDPVFRVVGLEEQSYSEGDEDQSVSE